jgi:hypothetical protein
MHPTLGRNDEIVGLRAGHHAAALVVGRARTAGDLRPAAGDERGALRWRWLERLRGGGSLAFLCFPWIEEMSRAHVVVARGPGGLVAHLAPGASALECRVGPLDEPLAVLKEDAPVRLGKAAEIRLSRDQRTVGQVFLFLGADPLRDAADAILRRLPDAQQNTVTGPMTPRHAWPLSPDQTRRVGDWIVAFVRAGGGEMAPWLRRELKLLSGPGTDDLRAYLASDRPPQSLARLLEHESNEATRSAIRARLEAESLVAEARAALPAQVWKAIDFPAGRTLLRPLD